ncbi:hypothetical protein B4U80_04799 [Leptotrombidium deliense]|uniref:SPRY domain-containing protein 7 n=1 Tax=Leptotrombidium deliense TaxID=299467 RepID=A0A443SCU7_9ACAR|nr:hypothetical protein B4U80_04799 [Leptotrombidium deliense]
MDCLHCVRTCFGFTRGPNYKLNLVKEQLISNVVLDTSNMGNDVVIVKNGHRICGTGAALASAPIVQNKAYFEVKIQQTGIWGLGLATSDVNVSRVPLGNDTESWVLRNDGTICHNNEAVFRLRETPMEGDIIGVTFDHIDLKFLLNNNIVEYSVTGIRGSELYPVLYVDEGAILDVSFASFQYSPPPGFDRILLEKSLL